MSQNGNGDNGNGGNGNGGNGNNGGGNGGNGNGGNGSDQDYDIYDQIYYPSRVRGNDYARYEQTVRALQEARRLRDQFPFGSENYLRLQAIVDRYRTNVEFLDDRLNDRFYTYDGYYYRPYYGGNPRYVYADGQTGLTTVPASATRTESNEFPLVTLYGTQPREGGSGEALAFWLLIGLLFVLLLLAIVAVIFSLSRNYASNERAVRATASPPAASPQVTVTST